MLATLVTAALVVAAGPAPDPATSAASICRAAGPDYYAIELFTTKNVPGTGLAKGVADVSVSPASPFSVSLTVDGSYMYDVSIALERMRAPRSGVLVAWVTTPELDQVERIGPLDEDLRASGETRWNKFIVVVSLEDEVDEAQTRWSGPIAFRGMSVSGRMHTMVGHGAFQQENCAAYGYGN